MSASISPAAKSSEAVQVLDELTRDSLRLLLPVTGAFVWAWAGFVILFRDPLIPFAYLALTLAISMGAISYRLHRGFPTLAVVVYLLGLMGVVTVVVACSREHSAYFLPSGFPIQFVSRTTSRP